MTKSNDNSDINKSSGSGRGGARPGAGRKKGQKIKKDIELKKSRSIRMTDEEYPRVLEFLKKIRMEQKAISEETATKV